MRKSLLSLLAMPVLFLAGCYTQPLSNAGYQQNPMYRGELSELDVLGVTSKERVTEEEIRNIIDERPEIRLGTGDPVVFIQSGALFPDEALIAPAKRVFSPIPLNGTPVSADRVPNLNQAMRLVAAKAGAKVMVVYWGQLEVSRKGYATQAVSWVPIAGWVLPDAERQLRIRLKAFVIDVRSGAWELLTTESYSESETTSLISEADAHNRMVESLKENAYKELVRQLQARYVD